MKIKFKNESLLMKIISTLLFFNKDFMSSYVTTIGKTVYFPSKEHFYKNEESSFIVLCHEAMHVNDSNKYTGLLFSFLYLFPQALFLFGFFGFLNPWMFLCFFFLLPLPSIRAYFEYRAYLVTLYVKNKMNYRIYIYDIIKQFTTSRYYWMFPFESLLEKKFAEKLLTVSYNKHPINDLFFIKIDKILSCDIDNQR